MQFVAIIGLTLVLAGLVAIAYAYSRNNDYEKCPHCGEYVEVEKLDDD